MQGKKSREKGLLRTDKAAFACFFGGIERVVRSLHAGLEISVAGNIPGGYGVADQLIVAGGENNRLADEPQASDSLFLGSAFHDNEELIPAQAENLIPLAAPENSLQPAGHGAESLVPGGMPVGVVDALEIVSAII